ncbi:MAG: gliding motility lipoprotein GldH [Ferruginibacter sp.]
MSSNSMKILLPAVCSWLFFSCTQINVFESSTSIPSYSWKSGFAVKGSFNIRDSAASYNTYIVLRHTDAYKYSNIWLSVGIQAAGDSMRYTKINIPLATDAAGWMGTGMDDIWELRHRVQLPLTKPGNYTYTLSQIMRDDPLSAVMSAGLRVEKP